MNVVNRLGLLGLYFFLLSPVTALADVQNLWTTNTTTDFSVNPDIQGLAVDMQPPDYVLEQRAGFRYQLSWQPMDDGWLDLHYEGTLSAVLMRGEGDPDFDTGLSAGRSYRVEDLNSTFDLGPEGMEYSQNLDRLVWHQYFSDFDLHVGRQAITFGSARFISGSDILYPLAVNESAPEFRTGVDAVRVEIPVGDLSLLDSGYVFGAEPEEGTWFGRYKFNYLNSDWILTDIESEGLTLRAFGWEGAADTIGLWQELVWFDHEQGEDWRWSGGLDQTFGDYLVSVEYHYNGAGVADNQQYLLNAAVHPLYQFGAVPLFAQRYLFVSANWLAGLRDQFSSSLAANLNDGSLLLTLTGGRSLNDRWGLNYHLDLPVGEEPSLEGAAYVPGSEFGTYPTRISLSIQGDF